MPAHQTSTSQGQLRWQNRLASCAVSSQVAVVFEAGYAAAITEMPGGRVRSPTTRSRTTRSVADCTAGGAALSSSRNSSPVFASTSLSAHDGGARETLAIAPTSCGF